MLARKLEPEVMDTAQEAVDYDTMDHSQVNRTFVDDLLRFLVDGGIADRNRLKILDVGTGTAQIPIELLGRPVSTEVTAIDLAGEMLKAAEQNVSRAGLGRSLKLELVDAKDLPYDDCTFDVVMSNSIVHHIPRPLDVFQEIVRVLGTGGFLFVRDLLRPPDRATLEYLVETYAGDANEHQQLMFANSLHAALTLEDIRELLSDVGLPADWAEQTTDRHWTISGRLSRSDD